MEQAGTGFKIRQRERINSSPKEGLRQRWTEYQVVSGRGKITARYDLLSQARQDFPGAELDSSITQ